MMQFLAEIVISDTWESILGGALLSYLGGLLLWGIRVELRLNELKVTDVEMSEKQAVMIAKVDRLAQDQQENHLKIQLMHQSIEQIKEVQLEIREDVKRMLAHKEVK